MPDISSEQLRKAMGALWKFEPLALQILELAPTSPHVSASMLAQRSAVLAEPREAA